MNILNAGYYRHLWISFIASVFISGCVGSPVTFPDVSGEKVDSYLGNRIQAKACGFQLLLVIPININDRTVRAYESLKRQAGQRLIADVKVQESWFYAFVGTGYCTTLQATAFPRVENPS